MCPDAFKLELVEKVDHYTSIGWWQPMFAHQAIPMLCILKPNGKLHIPVDLWLQNNNTVKDVTPFLDQDTIRHDVTRAKYHSLRLI